MGYKHSIADAKSACFFYNNKKSRFLSIRDPPRPKSWWKSFSTSKRGLLWLGGAQRTTVLPPLQVMRISRPVLVTFGLFKGCIQQARHIGIPLGRAVPAENNTDNPPFFTYS